MEGVRTVQDSLRQTATMGGGSTLPAIQQQPNMDVETVLVGKYPAKAHVKNVVEYMKKKDASIAKGGILYLEAQKTRMNEDNDEAAPFRQVYSPDCV